MIKIKPAKHFLLTCCAVGVLMAADTVWAADPINNCAQVSAATQDDADSIPNNKADSAAILAAVTAGTQEDDESCVVLTVTSVYDLGDAPDSYGTLVASNGAQHEIVPGLKLGNAIDEEGDGQPDTEAALEGADDDGVNLTALTDGQALTLSVTATNTTASNATLVCWIDYNGDGQFATDGSESGSSAVPTGSNGSVISVLMPQVPATASTDTGGTSYARCRLTTDPTLSADPKAFPQGVMIDGEVEDYKVTFAAAPTFDLALRKTLKVGQATSVQAGDDVTYTIEVLNQGGIDATDIVVTDYIPAGMELNDANWTANTDGSVATLTTPIASLAAGATTTVEITLKVRTDAVAGVKTNAAEISAANDDKGVMGVDVDSTPDTNPTNDVRVDDVIDNTGNDEDDHDIADVTVAPTIDIELTKTLDKATVRRGETVKYTLTVTNKGPDNATGITVSDKLPAGLTYVSDNGGGTYDAVSGLWTVGSLNNTETKTLEITATVN